MADKNTGKPKFFKGVKSEFKKITWPGKDDLVKETVSVVCVSAVLAALIAVFDLAIQYGVNVLMK
ncbi:MAG: preprotein translocase subunit SecE [Lachnospiraceae bacterium]|nr:preprotein translocase subunit SecE [Lachnospiraceae bacterium]